MPAVPTAAQDYPEWHKGRQHYALWYLEIRQPEVLAYLAQLRRHFGDFLFHPNTRQFHITLFVCGFLHQHKRYDDDFTDLELNAQLQQLQRLNLAPFQLKTGKINSFESALFIEIEDAEQALDAIRQQLSRCSGEIAPLSYCPHITLGLYSHAFNSNELFRRADEIEQQSFELKIQQLTFGAYAAQQLQGPLSACQQFNLGGL